MGQGLDFPPPQGLPQSHLCKGEAGKKVAGDTCLCSYLDKLGLFLVRKELACFGKTVERVLGKSYLAVKEPTWLLGLYPGMVPFGLLVDLPLSD